MQSRSRVVVQHERTRVRDTTALLTYRYQPVTVALSFRADAPAMIDPYDPPHPDGPDDDDDLPGAPTSVSWLDDDDPADEEWSSPFPETALD